MKKLLTSLIICWVLVPAAAQHQLRQETVAPGVVKITYGVPDRETPHSVAPAGPLVSNMEALDEGFFPFPLGEIKANINERGCQLEIPLLKDEQLYGFGLQIGSFTQRGLKRKPIVNDNPLNNLGYTHAPQTFYVSSKGYGILVNTFRYTTFYCGTNKKLKDSEHASIRSTGLVHDSTDDLYRNEKSGDFLYVDVPHAQGIEVFVFAGTGMLNVVQRYNLFSGGGCLPPLWGLGLKYRVKTDFTQEKTLLTADYIRETGIPCDVMGLEPGWQTAAYSCSYVWNRERFPDHRGMIERLKNQNYRINLWEHAYVHPTSPLWEPLQEYSGDFLVWQGLVPDFTLPQARELFTGYHRGLLQEGISGFKLDECDNSNISSAEANWGFPDMSVFPSGMDGERMHQAFGGLYVNTLNDMYVKENMRTYQDYRSSGMFMSSVPAVLYSDIYGQKDYVQMMCNAAFGGLLWSPEVRRSGSANEFFHRLQTAVLAPVTTINSWYLENPPWKQYDVDKNNSNEFLPNVEEMEGYVKRLVETRMSLIPYLYSSFADYADKGIPPFRPLVMDFPEDGKTANISDQYMVGKYMLAAPLVEFSNTRKVYLPEGVWYNFNTGEKYSGGTEYEFETGFGELPLFVREGAIVPMAKPETHVADDLIFDITVRVYGRTTDTFRLWEDDGLSYDYTGGQYNTVVLSVGKKKGSYKRSGNYPGERYRISGWNFID